MNRYKVQKEAEPKKKKRGNRQANKVARSFRDVLNGNVLAKDYVIENLPFIFFLTVIMLMYIALGYQADRTVRGSEQLESEIMELKSEYISVKTELNLISRQSQIADSTESMGLLEMKDEPPVLLGVSKELKESIY